MELFLEMGYERNFGLVGLLPRGVVCIFVGVYYMEGDMWIHNLW